MEIVNDPDLPSLLRVLYLFCQAIWIAAIYGKLESTFTD